ncbi:hypothetical protein [Brevundimonas subvibrioides]|uniref:Uncharacterized protein n=1 Tax=Brevundimonas subvibrioides (strain ATCC 15264 / DSM 4735 / LMG 14903 / NBRC 16000 / CB 81) TaxID=633149 RepID=D9QNI7_BRESC|nr:hypothetical protein [Brevundimonas subvibrioides]ADL02222.1 hypothetical protein Bresu_2915 [Brevundimonas subvibrioides ATCC 15264]
MTTLKIWLKDMLRNVPSKLADLGLNFASSVIATINGPGRPAGAVSLSQVRVS